MEVELPEGLEKIERNTFSRCRNLEIARISSTVREIGEYAFQDCCRLKAIDLPQGLVQIGKGAFAGCRLLETIRISPLIQTIEVEAFSQCDSLTELILPPNLLEIKDCAFENCKSLASVDFPSSLRVIGKSSFKGTGLTELNLPDSVEYCGPFEHCKFPNLRLPPLITKFDMGTSEGRTISLEVPENIEQIIIPCHEHSLLNGLRNVAFPVGCTFVRGGTILEVLDNRLLRRLDGLPVHKICHYHSYHDAGTSIRDLKRAIHPWSTKTRPGKLSDVGKLQDTVGMTPLHILACSTKHHLEMYQLLVEKYPENLVTKDQWEDIPLLYALWCNAPSKIVEFLVESYKVYHPDYTIDWKRMLETLISFGAPHPRVQFLMEMHELLFPEQKLDVKYVVQKLAYGKDNEFVELPEESFRFLLRSSISKRLDSLNVRQWRSILEKQVSVMRFLPFGLYDRKLELYNLLNVFEYLKEVSTLLELALWNATMADRLPKNKKAKIDDQHSCRYQCRINCGSEIVVPNVLPFLWRGFDGPE